MGIVEVGRVFSKFIKAFRQLKAAAVERSPDAVVLVDWPEFNLRLASSLHRRGLKVIYYISPQLWAWRPRRVNNVKRDVDLLLSILPFEIEWYRAHGVEHVEFVGHPLSGEVKARFGREEFCRRNDLDPGRPSFRFCRAAGSKNYSASCRRWLMRLNDCEARALTFNRCRRRAEPHGCRDSRDRCELASNSWSGKLVRHSLRRCRSYRERHCDAGSRTARNADGCCLQRVANQLAHTRATDSSATLWISKPRGGKRDREELDAGRSRPGRTVATGLPESDRTGN
jgi:hypothetical protein